MKAVCTFLLFVTLGCHRQDTNTVNSQVDTDSSSKKVVERDVDEDGKPDFRLEIVYRAKRKIMMIWSEPNPQGVMNVVSRSYSTGGDLAMTEIDRDRDGVFETLIVYGSVTAALEVFTRQPDGSVAPVDAQTLAAFRKEHGAIDEFWERAYEDRPELGKAMELMRNTQRKIRGANQEITNRLDVGPKTNPR